MEYLENNWKFLAGAATATAVAIAVNAAQSGASSEAPVVAELPKRSKTCVGTGYQYAIIGDIGGTNVRLELIRINLEDVEEEAQIIKEGRFDPQKTESCITCIKQLLTEVNDETKKPLTGVVGIAGPVVDNVVDSTNIPGWGDQNGDEIAKALGLKSFIFINDFMAAGYGVTCLKKTDAVPLNDAAKNYQVQHGREVKVVIGPGTGLGEGILVRADEGQLFEPYPSEGGHVDFNVITEEDFKLQQFALKYIETSNNKENMKVKRVTKRLCVEAMVAGPGVPCIYEFMKTQYPKLERILEKENEHGKAIAVDDISPKDVIGTAMKTKDPLLMKVVEKLTQNFGHETGNLALKVLPYGGIYLIGGVTTGIRDYLINEPTFMAAFQNKGRLSKTLMTQFPIFLVNDVEIGLMGAKERARRELIAAAESKQ